MMLSSVVVALVVVFLLVCFCSGYTGFLVGKRVSAISLISG